MRRFFVLLSLTVALQVMISPVLVASASSADTARALPGADLFACTNVPAFSIDIDAANLQSLRREPRSWAKATLRCGNEVYPDVGLHIKGSQGSLQSIDQRPALTVSLNKFVSGRKFHGLRKIHFNNTAEDPTFMNEIICAELCRQAGLPAARSGYATLKLNGRRLGLYVLKEGLTKEFLAQYFERTDGNLYDGGFRRDIDQPLERIHGDGPDDQADRRALLAAVREPDPARRWERLERVLDMDRFITLLAITTITWNWDGYPMARNNYRIYHDPATDKMVFIPHGLDQMFWQPQGTIFPRMNAMVASAVMRAPEGRQRYLARLAELHTDVFKVDVITNHVNQLATLIGPYLPGAEAQAVKLHRQIVGRARSLAEQLQVPEAPTVKFVDDVALLRRWNKSTGEGSAVLDQSTNSPRALHIKAARATTAAWVMRTTLPAGSYEFRARVKTLAMQAAGGERMTGAGLRCSGAAGSSSRRLVEDSDWQELTCRFAVRGAEEPVDLACELRGSRGEVWFDLNSLQLRRVSGSSLLNLFR